MTYGFFFWDIGHLICLGMDDIDNFLFDMEIHYLQHYTIFSYHFIAHIVLLQYILCYLCT